MENITLQERKFSKTRVIISIILGLVFIASAVYELFSKQLIPSSYNIADNYIEDAIIRILLALSFIGGSIVMSSIQMNLRTKKTITNFSLLCFIGFLLAVLHAGIKL